MAKKVVVKSKAKVVAKGTPAKVNVGSTTAPLVFKLKVEPKSVPS